MTCLALYDKFLVAMTNAAHAQRKDAPLAGSAQRV